MSDKLIQKYLVLNILLFISYISYFVMCFNNYNDILYAILIFCILILSLGSCVSTQLSNLGFKSNFIVDYGDAIIKLLLLTTFFGVSTYINIKLVIYICCSLIIINIPIIIYNAIYLIRNNITENSYKAKLSEYKIKDKTTYNKVLKFEFLLILLPSVFYFSKIDSIKIILASFFAILMLVIVNIYNMVKNLKIYNYRKNAIIKIVIIMIVTFILVSALSYMKINLYFGVLLMALSYMLMTTIMRNKQNNSWNCFSHSRKANDINEMTFYYGVSFK